MALTSTGISLSFLPRQSRDESSWIDYDQTRTDPNESKGGGSTLWTCVRAKLCLFCMDALALWTQRTHHLLRTSTNRPWLFERSK